MSAIAAAALALPISFCCSPKLNNKRSVKSQSIRGGFRVFSLIDEEGGQYCDWKARQDVLTIMHLHEKVVDVLNPLARDFKSVGTLKKELAELQDELSQSHNQVHISEARVSAAFDKLAQRGSNCS
ncbi:hypothetical protein ACS0TY_035984 [Phlomoides rotata]